MVLDTSPVLNELFQAQHSLRPLGPFEELLFQMDKRSPLHASLVVHVDGLTTIEGWKGALERTRRRHPLWSAVVTEAKGERPCFQEMLDPRVSLRVIKGDFSPYWEREVARELSLPTDHENGPLVRAVLLHTDASCMLILSAHHSICDGMSLAFAIRDTLQALSGIKLEELDLHGSEEDTLGLLSQPRPQRLGAEQLPEPWTNFSVYRSCSSLVPEVSSLQFSCAFTEALRKRAREERTTVHAALVAAAGIAARRQPGYGSGRDLHLCSTISNRALLDSPEDCGVFFTASDFTLADGALDDLWDLARKAKQSLVPAQTADGAKAVLRAVGGIVSSSLDDYSAGEEGGKLFLFDIHVSNLGADPIPTLYGGLSLRQLWGPAVLIGFDGEQNLGASTVNGRLSLLHTSHRPLPGFLDRLESILSSACAS